MKKILICTSLLFTGCPIAMDFTVGMGGNQSIKKTLDMNQVQTDKQSDNQTTVLEDIVNVIPFLVPEPTPTPVPEAKQKVKSITIEMEPKKVPEIPVYTKQPYLPPARKPKPYIPECKK